MNIKPSLDTLLHYGTKRHSGRYPWGSGEEPRSESVRFLAQVDELRGRGIKDTDIAKELGMNTTQLRNKITWANAERDANNRSQAQTLKEAGMSNVAIGKKLGVSEATVRNYLADKEEVVKAKRMQLENINEAIKSGVDRTGYLDVGVGVERQLGIPRNKFNTVVNKMVAEEGYYIHEVHIQRLNDPSKWTTIKVLTKEPDVTVARHNSDKIGHLDTFSDDNAQTLIKLGKPQMIDLKRIKVRYAEDGGAEKDGLIELRPGVKDLDLGNSKYAQVRIGAGDNLYLKGMAAYSDDKFPDGVDIIFNTNKGKDTPVDKVLKEMKMKPHETDDPSFMFGSTVYKQKGALNIVNEEGDWDTWSTKMSSQFLSKQPVNLIKDRLDDTYSSLKKEFDEINSMTNPIVKKYLMESYIDGLDAKANHLKAKGLARTKSHVLLPFPDMKPNEIYAPHYDNGERVVLVRHPHGGIFEIPDLIVNNRHAGAKKMLGTDAPDAVGIHPSVAAKLSGADFDGDTALVIPNNQGKIKTSRSLKELEGFEPKMYKVTKDSPVNMHVYDEKTGKMVNTGKTITKGYQQTQMGIVSNLITDMTIKDASTSEIARAVRHSMVVIDAEKHNLDYKQSARDNSISALVKKYQTHINPDTGKVSKGASTLISRSKSKVDISDNTKIVNSISQSIVKTGYLNINDGVEKRIGVTKDKFNSAVKAMIKKEGYYVHDITDNTGKTTKVLTKDPDIKKNPRISNIDPWTFDPDKYSSGRAQEQLYSDYIKNIQKTKNEALKEYMSITSPKYSPEAAKFYVNEVKSINQKLNVALLNAPKERQAQAISSNLFYSQFQKDMTPDEIKKLKNRSLAKARVEAGAKKTEIKLTEMEWEAIQAGSISNDKLLKVLKNANMDIVRKLAAPRELMLSTAKVARAKMWLDKGYSYAEVANMLGVSTSTIREELGLKKQRGVDDNG